MKNLVLVILVLVILGLGNSCTDYQALYSQKNLESTSLAQQVYALQSELANANNSINNLNGQVNTLNQQNASLQAQLTQALNKPPQIQYVEVPVYKDRVVYRDSYVQVPVYVPSPPAPRPHPPGPRPPKP